MSVLQCDRKHCPNVMCDIFMEGVGMYICPDCYDELIKFRKQWDEPMTKQEVADKIRWFMVTSIGSFDDRYYPNSKEIEDEFKRLTSRSEEGD